MATGAAPYDWVIRLVVELLLIFTFSCVLLRPLWKLAMSRPSLIIVFSRAIGNYLRLFGAMPQHIVYYIFNIPMTPEQSYYWAYLYSLNGYYAITTISAHVHNLALAVNRSHAMFFPFHYNMVFVKKKNIYVLCLCLWLICICVGSSDQFVKTLTKFTGTISPANELSKYCMYASGLCYTALGCRMLWIRYKSSSMSGTSVEKDSIKILFVCFTCLSMTTLSQFVFIPFAQYANAKFSDTPRLAVYWGNNITQWLIYFTEEICLALLVRDFRQNVKQQLRSVFRCCRGNSESISNGNNATRTVRVIQVTKVNTLVKSI